MWEKQVVKSSWSKGLTASTDERVARMAASKRGRSNWALGLSARTDPRVARQSEARRGQKRGPYKTQNGQPRRGLSSGADCLREDQYEVYAYLLGLYLGDGYVVLSTCRLEISLDRKYPRVIESCAAAMKLIHPRGKANVRGKGNGNGAVVVNSYAAEWVVLFPHHGRGRKHLRSIQLLPWQVAIVNEYSAAFVRGLIQSDGCRYDRKVGGKIYPAYDFSNESADIMKMCELACSRLGVRFRRPARNRLAIARRTDVAVLDAVIGAK